MPPVVRIDDVAARAVTHAVTIPTDAPEGEPVVIAHAPLDSRKAELALLPAVAWPCD